MIGQAPDFVLRAQDGAEVTLAQFRGKAVALDLHLRLLFLHLPNSHSEDGESCRIASAATSASRIVFLSITVDPEHDSPEVLSRYAETFGADPAGWKFLTVRRMRFRRSNVATACLRRARPQAKWTTPT